MRAIVPWDVGSYPYAEINYANPHAVTSVGGATYTYDNHGNSPRSGSSSSGGNGSLQSTGGGNGISPTQIGALQNFVSVVNASSFNAQTFVTALQGVVKAFGAN